MTTSAPTRRPRADGSPVLTVDRLSIRAGTLSLVTDVSFTIARGQRVGMIGASGSGKTLTAMAIAGLLPPELMASGSVRLSGFDSDLVNTSEHAVAGVRGRLTGMVFQEPMTALNPTMRIDRQVAEAVRLHRRLSRTVLKAETVALLHAVGMTDAARIAASYPHQLSGGQRQRVVLAMAIANDPPLLICDEPTTALDVSVQAQVLRLIDERAAQSGAAVLFISHDLAVVASICDYLLVMWEGRIVEHGRVVEVLTHPRHHHTRRLLADADLTSAERADGPEEGRTS